MDPQTLTVISIIVSAVLAIGGGILTILVMIIGWMLRRLIKSLDGLHEGVTQLTKDMITRPQTSEMEARVRESVMDHERVWHNDRREGPAK